MSIATVQYGLEKYGATMTLEDVLVELHVSERSFRNGMITGTYPKSRTRGKWSTELIMQAAAQDPQEVRHDSKNNSPETDPFVCGAIPENGCSA